MKPVLELLKVTHATSAGLKAFCTYAAAVRSRYRNVAYSREPPHFALALARHTRWSTLELIEQARQTLGGHGYSAYAGLAALYQDFAVQCSWEVCEDRGNLVDGRRTS